MAIVTDRSASVTTDPARFPQARARRIQMPLLAGVGLVALSGMTANPFITIFSVGVAGGLIFLLWRPQEPPVLLFACAIQWVQVTTVLHYSNFAGATLVDAFGGPQLQSAVLMGLIGLLLLGWGGRIGMGKADNRRAHSAEIEIGEIQPFKVFAIYLAILAINAGMGMLANRLPSIAQLLLSVVTIKWVILFVLFYAVLQHRRRYGLLWAAVGIEFAVGLLGFFAAFKSVFFLLIVVLLGTSDFWNLRRVVLGAVVCGFLILSSIIWSAIKVDYRDFLNQGSGIQEVVVPVDERIATLTELTKDLTDEGFFRGVEALIARVSYVTYFAMAIDNVPDKMPHENGRLWRETVQHVFMPRLFFPNKPVINDSERTSLYTGVRVAGQEQGTSISMGYMAESYIDFGPIGMFLPVFLLGLFYGLLYRAFLKWSRFKLLGFALYTSVILFAAYNFETSNIKLVGGITVCAIFAAMFLTFAERPFAQITGLTEVTSIDRVKGD